ncbi:gag-polypeptide of LTR copia-type domain-containing protein [Phthorimaea operculella]|nr:gag-polypeptide of LTR copia-type domain-containing protein [Phthorimaea operculella]
MILMHEDLSEYIATEAGSTDPKKNQKALAKICLSVGPSVLPQIRDATTPYKAWKNLETAYQDKGLCRRLGLLRALFGMKLNQMESMEAYVSKISELSQQLTDIGSPLDDDFVAVIMLSGLPDSYDPLIMALESTNTTLTSEKVKSRLLQEQSRRDDKTENSDLGALAVQKRNDGYGVRCHRCKKIGHMKKDCPRNNKDKNSKKKAPAPYQHRSLFTALSGNLKKDEWHMDSGATNHMCNRRDVIKDYQSIDPIEVNVANGEQLKAVGIGTVQIRLSSGVKNISNVYYVPGLFTNLLSVSELDRKGFSTNFGNLSCKVLDDGQLVATATHNSGVYQLDTMNMGLECSLGTVDAGSVSSEESTRDARGAGALSSVCEPSQEVHPVLILKIQIP